MSDYKNTSFVNGVYLAYFLLGNNTKSNKFFDVFEDLKITQIKYLLVIFGFAQKELYGKRDSKVNIEDIEIAISYEDMDQFFTHNYGKSSCRVKQILLKVKSSKYFSSFKLTKEGIVFSVNSSFFDLYNGKEYDNKKKDIFIEFESIQHIKSLKNLFTTISERYFKIAVFGRNFLFKLFDMNRTNRKEKISSHKTLRCIMNKKNRVFFYSNGHFYFMEKSKATVEELFKTIQEQEKRVGIAIKERTTMKGLLKYIDKIKSSKPLDFEAAIKEQEENEAFFSISDDVFD